MQDFFLITFFILTTIGLIFSIIFKETNDDIVHHFYNTTFFYIFVNEINKKNKDEINEELLKLIKESAVYYNKKLHKKYSDITEHHNVNIVKIKLYHDIVKYLDEGDEESYNILKEYLNSDKDVQEEFMSLYRKKYDIIKKNKYIKR